MTRPKLLDLFCCDGAASMGYYQAGFDVVGVDIEAHPDYPFEFHHGDALEFAKNHAHEFDAIAASPPCQALTRLRHYDTNDTDAYRAKYPNLIAPTRDVLEAAGKPYVIENVEPARAHLRRPLLLCGDMFGLRMYRHRLFESNIDLEAPQHPTPYHAALCTRNGYVPTPDRPFMSIHGGKHSKAWLEAARQCMGTPWVGRSVSTFTAIRFISEAIPPAYTRYLGTQLVAHIGG